MKMTYKHNGLELLVFLILLFQSCTSGSLKESRVEKSIKPGETERRITCNADTSCTYALFIPSGYKPGYSSPVLICFDPHADGLLPVNLFSEQAEQYGFILAGSNNSKNGMTTEETTSIYRKILTDIQSRFIVDVKSIYVAGFSGGSRVAGAAAITEGNIAGVIGCGAGLPNLSRQPSAPFSYLAVAGTQDFNYNELRQLDQSLEGAGYIHHLLDFDGPHQWPPRELVPSIFTWLSFDRMRKGTHPTDRDAINLFIDQNYSLAEAAGKRGELLNQQSALVMMKDYLQGLTDVTPLESEIEKLDRDPKVIQQKASKALIFDRESALQADYSTALQVKGPGWWTTEAGKLKAIADKMPASDEGRMYKRILGFLSLNTYMLANSALKQQNLPVASNYIEIYRSVDPDNAEHRYMAAMVLMYEGQSEKALKELEKAINLGFRDYPRLKNDPVFAPLRDDPQFSKLLKGK